MIEFKDFVDKLESIGSKKILEENGFFRRLILEKNELRQNDIVFVWYSNKCSAGIGDIKLTHYNDIEINGFWPNRFSLNVNLLLDGNTVCVIPLEN